MASPKFWEGQNAWVWASNSVFVWDAASQSEKWLDMLNILFVFLPRDLIMQPLSLICLLPFPNLLGFTWPCPLPWHPEKSFFSNLKVIKTYLRSSIQQKHLNSLAIISIESKIRKCLNLGKILRNFADVKAQNKFILASKCNFRIVDCDSGSGTQISGSGSGSSFCNLKLLAMGVGRGGGGLAFLDFKIFCKKGCFPSFEWEKSNFTTFGLP